MNDLPPQEAKVFWSIERFVAFVLGPAVTAGSGSLSLYLAKRFGVHLDPAVLLGIFATGGLSAAALAWKWLHGRQLEAYVVKTVLGKYVPFTPPHTTGPEGAAQASGS